MVQRSQLSFEHLVLSRVCDFDLVTPQYELRMEILKERVRNNRSSVLLQDSRGHAKLLAYLHSVSRILVDNIVSRSPPSFGDIHDGRNDNVSRVRGHGVKANLDGEFASVFPHTK